MGEEVRLVEPEERTRNAEAWQRRYSAFARYDAPESWSGRYEEMKKCAREAMLRTMVQAEPTAPHVPFSSLYAEALRGRALAPFPFSRRLSSRRQVMDRPRAAVGATAPPNISQKSPAFQRRANGNYYFSAQHYSPLFFLPGQRYR